LETTEAELVDRCRNGDSHAWEIIVRRRHSRIYNLAYRFTGRFDEAEDLTQEVFLKVYRTLDSYRPASGAFETWILRVARNHFIDHYRKHKTERLQTGPLESEHESGRAMASPMDSPGRALERQETSDRIHGLLAQLPEDQREAVVLRDLEEMSYEEIAMILSVPVGTVKSRINRGRIGLVRLINAGNV
jgi:RNA polymerase sigma-70 factor (ECF subfamily)